MRAHHSSHPCRYRDHQYQRTCHSWHGCPICGHCSYDCPGTHYSEYHPDDDNGVYSNAPKVGVPTSSTAVQGDMSESGQLAKLSELVMHLIAKVDGLEKKNKQSTDSKDDNDDGK